MEIHDFRAQKTHPALTAIAANPRLFARQGAVTVSHRRVGRRSYGPYYQLDFWQDRRHRSIYLGGPGPLVEQVRQALAAVQEPVREFDAFGRIQREAAASLRIARRGLNGALGSLGLRLQGAEVRGWRTSHLRALFREAKKLM